MNQGWRLTPDEKALMLERGEDHRAEGLALVMRSSSAVLVRVGSSRYEVPGGILQARAARLLAERVLERSVDSGSISVEVVRSLEAELLASARGSR